MQAEFASNTANKLGFTLGVADWKLHNSASIFLTNNRATFDIVNLTASSRSVDLTVDGVLKMGAVSINTQAKMATRAARWQLAISVSGLQLGTVLSAVGMAKLTTIPDAIWNLTLRSGSLTLHPMSKSMTVNVNTDYGQMEGLISAPESGFSYLIGISPGSEMKFSSIHSSMAFLDELGLKNSMIAISSSPQKTSAGMTRWLGVSADVGKGLTIMANYNLNALSPELVNWVGKSDLMFSATVSTNIADVKFSANLGTNILLDKDGNVALKGGNIYMYPNPNGFKVGIGGQMQVKINKDVLMFVSDIALDISNLHIQVSGRMDGAWNNPFGMSPGLQVANLGLGFGASFKTTPIPIPTLEMKGEMKAGYSLSSPIFQGDVAVGVDPSNPLNCMIDAGFAKIKINDIIKAFTPDVKIPDEMKNTILALEMNDCRLTVVPSPTGIRLLGKSYQPGFLVKGKTKISEAYADLLMSVSATNGIEASAAMSSLDYQPYFSFTGAVGARDPSFYLHLKPTVINSKMAMSGRVTALGLMAQAEMIFGDFGMRVDLSGKIFQLFNADFSVQGKTMTNGTALNVSANMKNDLFTFFNQHAANEIDKATKTNQQAFKDAQNTLTREQNEVKRLDGEIASMRSKVNAERNADCAKFNAAKKDVDNAQSKVNSIQKDIDAKKQKIKSLEKEIKDKPLKAVENGAKITKLGTEIAGLETAKGTANGVLKAYKATLSGMQGLCKTTPIDLDPRIAGLLTARHTAVGSLEAAKKIVEGVGVVSTGSLKATKWIVQNGNPMGVVNITSASFSGNLSQVNNGTVQLVVKGTFAGDPLNTTLTFNFKDAQKTVEAFARSLVN